MGEDSIHALNDIERIAAEASGKSGDPEVGATERPDRIRRDAKPPVEGEHVGDFNIRIGRDGTWYYRGSPIHRLPLVKLFASVLRRGEDGSYRLVTPVENGTILVEDAPFVAVDMDVNQGDGPAEATQTLSFRTNLGETVTAGADNPIRVEIDRETGEPCPYVMVREGLDALIGRSVFYRMVEMADERPVPDGKSVDMGVWSNGIFFSLGRVESDLVQEQE